jgi:integrase
MEIADLLGYESVKSWLNSLKASGRGSGETLRKYLFWLGAFCDLHNTDPDAIIQERLRSMASGDLMAMQRLKSMLDSFVIHLEERRGLRRNSIAQAVYAVKSFLAHNGLPVKYTFSFEEGVGGRLPTPEEILAVYNALDKVSEKHCEELKAFVLVAKDSGLSLSTILSLRWEAPQSAWGERPYPSIAQQLEAGANPIHVRVVRRKTGVKHDTFMGEESIAALRVLYEKHGGRGLLIPLRDAYIRGRLARACRLARVEPFGPQMLRKFFNTRMKLAPAMLENVSLQQGYRVYMDVWANLVEYMCEHSRSRVEKAYFIPPPEVLRELYLAHYDALRIFPKKC